MSVFQHVIFRLQVMEFKVAASGIYCKAPKREGEYPPINAFINHQQSKNPQPAIFQNIINMYWTTLLHQAT